MTITYPNGRHEAVNAALASRLVQGCINVKLTVYFLAGGGLDAPCAALVKVPTWYAMGPGVR